MDGRSRSRQLVYDALGDRQLDYFDDAIAAIAQAVRSIMQEVESRLTLPDLLNLPILRALEITPELAYDSNSQALCELVLGRIVRRVDDDLRAQFSAADGFTPFEVAGAIKGDPVLQWILFTDFSGY